MNGQPVVLWADSDGTHTRMHIEDGVRDFHLHLLGDPRTCADGWEDVGFTSQCSEAGK